MPTRPLNALFLGAAKRVSVARQFKLAATELGFDPTVFSYELSAAVPIATEAEIVIGESFRSAEIVTDLRRVITGHKIDICLAFHDAAVRVLADLESNVFAPHMNPALVDIFSSKIETGRFLRDERVPVPPKATTVPAIAKPDFGSSSKGLRFFYEQSDLDRFLASSDSASYETQQLISGPEFSVDAYRSMNSDQYLYAVRERLEVLGGEVSVTKTVDRPDLDLIAERIGSLPGISGPFTIQLIEDRATGEAFVMEINPRFGGGMPATALAGVPWMRNVINDWQGLPLEAPAYNRNYLVLRSFEEHGFELEP